MWLIPYLVRSILRPAECLTCHATYNNIHQEWQVALRHYALCCGIRFANDAEPTQRRGVKMSLRSEIPTARPHVGLYSLASSSRFG